MYKTKEFYDSNGLDLKEVLKSCIYKYYIKHRNNVSKNGFDMDEKSSIISSTNKVEILSMKGDKSV